MKTKRTIETEVYGIRGEGTTKTEAKRNAIERIESLSTGIFEPTVLIEGGYTGLVFRTPYGYAYTIINPANFTRKNEDSTINYFTSGYGDDRAETERHLRRHLAQYLYDDNKDESDFGSIRVILSERDRNDHKSWMKWHRLYRNWTAAGLDSEAAREKANIYEDVPSLTITPIAAEAILS